MGLDIYVGSFTRYCAGDWETIVAKAAREQGMAFQVIRTNPDPADKITDPAVIRSVVEQWRSGLEQSLRPHLPEGLSWNEEPNSNYFSDKPDWIGYAGLILLAAHTALPKFPLPERATTDFDQDPAFQELGANDFRCPFSQIFDVKTWLPCAFPFTFEAEDIFGDQMRFGSSVTLLEQLRKLNAETYKGDSETLARWKFDGAGREDTFEKTAKFGLTMFLHHAELSVTHRLPMKLDY